MKQINVKTIGVNEATWKELNNIKYHNNLKTISDAIDFVLNKNHLLEQKVNVFFDKKFNDKVVKANRKEK